METNISPSQPASQLARPRDISPGVMAMIMSLAPVIHQSRLFGVASLEQAATVMLKGHELGLPLTAAFELIHIVQGKPSLSPRGALAIIMSSGLLAELMIDEQTDSCTVTMKRTNGFTYTTSFTMDDARRAGVIKDGGGWQSYPANMLRWRAIGFCADVVFPDVLAGMKRADEFGAPITPNGDVIVQEVSRA